MGTYFAGLIQAKRTGERPRPAAAASRTTVTKDVRAPMLSDTGDVPRVTAPTDPTPHRESPPATTAGDRDPDAGARTGA